MERRVSLWLPPGDKAVHFSWWWLIVSAARFQWDQSHADNCSAIFGIRCHRELMLSKITPHHQLLKAPYIKIILLGIWQIFPMRSGKHFKKYSIWLKICSTFCKSQNYSLQRHTAKCLSLIIFFRLLHHWKEMFFHSSSEFSMGLVPWLSWQMCDLGLLVMQVFRHFAYNVTAISPSAPRSRLRGATKGKGGE